MLQFRAAAAGGRRAAMLARVALARTEGAAAASTAAGALAPNPAGASAVVSAKATGRLCPNAVTEAGAAPKWAARIGMALPLGSAAKMATAGGEEARGAAACEGDLACWGLPRGAAAKMATVGGLEARGATAAKEAFLGLPLAVAVKMATVSSLESHGAAAANKAEEALLPLPLAVAVKMATVSGLESHGATATKNTEEAFLGLPLAVAVKMATASGLEAHSATAANKTEEAFLPLPLAVAVKTATVGGLEAQGATFCPIYWSPVAGADGMDLPCRRALSAAAVTWAGIALPLSGGLALGLDGCLAEGLWLAFSDNNDAIGGGTDGKGGTGGAGGGGGAEGEGSGADGNGGDSSAGGGGNGDDNGGEGRDGGGDHARRNTARPRLIHGKIDELKRITVGVGRKVDQGFSETKISMKNSATLGKKVLTHVKLIPFTVTGGVLVGLLIFGYMTVVYGVPYVLNIVGGEMLKWFKDVTIDDITLFMEHATKTVMDEVWGSFTWKRLLTKLFEKFK